MHLKMSSAKWRLSRCGLNVLNVRRFCETHPINMRIFFCLCRKHSHIRGNILFARIIWIWVISLWGRLNTNISPHRYRDPHYRVTIIMGIFIPGKTVFILKQGPVLGHDWKFLEIQCSNNKYDDVIKWNHFPRYWSFVRVIHRSPVNSPHKGQWCRALVFDLRMNKRLSKQSWGWWFETPSRSLWRHCNEFSPLCEP